MSIVSIAKPGSTFVPTQISGCQLWLDAADPAGTGTPPSNNATVATWKDKSGKGRDSPANSTGATFNTNSQNGNGALSFTTGQYYITPSFVATANNTPTIFLVCQQTSAAASGNSEVIYANIGTPQPWYTLDLYGGGSTKLLYLNIYANVNTNGGISIANPTLISVVGTGAPTYTATMWGNGTSNVSFTGSSASPMSVSSPYNIGAISAFIGKIYEVLFYDTPLGDTARQQIEGYLAQKWGLTSQLPAGHPGLTQTFYGTARSTVIPIILLPFNIYTNYNPLTATGSTCILWLDASDPTTLFSDPAGTTLATVNGTVGYWRDKSSSGFNCTQTTLSYRPTYVAAAKNGRSILSFNGLTNFLNLPQFTAVPLTIFFVAQGTVFLTNTFFLSLGNAGSTVMMRMLHIPEYYGVDGPGMLISTTNADTNWHLWTLTISSTTETFYFDGVIVGTSSWSNGSAYTFATNTIAAWNQQVGGKATTLRIPEILFYSAVLGTTQQRQVESYLTEKWGLVSQPTRGVASIVAIPKISFASSGLVITHQDGRPWKLTGTAVALNAGTQMSLTIYAGANVYNSANGRVGLFNNGSSSAAIRHSGYVMYANTFGANNYDFGWYFVSSGSKYLIYNDYPSIGSAWQVSYDPAQDRVLIVSPGDAKYGMLWTITPRVTLSYVYTSYPT